MIWTHAAGNRFISFILCHKRDCMHFTATPGETWLYMFMYIIFLQLWCWKLNSIYFLFIAKYLSLYVYVYHLSSPFVLETKFYIFSMYCKILGFISLCKTSFFSYGAVKLNSIYFLYIAKYLAF